MKTPPALKPMFEAFEGTGYTIQLLGRTLGYLPKAFKMRKYVVEQAYNSIFGGFPVCFIVAIFTGMILALQAGHQLAQYGQEHNLGVLVSLSMIREMGPVMAAFIMAGLVGSTMAAELGTMNVSDEIDALEIMSISPIRFLVMPRVLALSVGIPVLVIYVNLIGVAGGGLVANGVFEVSWQQYNSSAINYLEMKDILTSLLKGLTFGLIISTVACSQGLRARGGAMGVGQNTMKAVVISFIFILVTDYAITRVVF
jgi:phospholipid/cholesterol/gamma-HCH transport system permease protein